MGKGVKARSMTTVKPMPVGKRQGWRITVDGAQKTVITSAQSSAAIREAAERYDDALTRLAKR